MYHWVRLSLRRPASESPEMAAALIEEGMNVARLNFSHGTHSEHRKKMNGVLEAVHRKPGSHVAILLDTKGP